MATTGFWPVHGRLKEVLNYAENPDKTTPKEFLDEDLYAAIRYAENDAKTDRTMFVSGINCSKHNAYNEMMAVKQRFGERGTNIAYHGYQSFKEGEVTPEEAHQIGLETARQMWGSRYQVVVTTHLNTENLHNHFIVNSVSFVDGKKFRNSIGDRLELRKISDAICAQRGKSVIDGNKFYGNKKQHWAEKDRNLSHREQLRRDIEKILPGCKDMDAFESRMRALGYSFPRGEDYAHMTILAPGWYRSVRLDSIGYTKDALWDRFDKNYEDPNFYHVRNYNPPYKPKRFPLLELERKLIWEIDHSHDVTVVLVDVLFVILLELLQLSRNEDAYRERRQPLSPELRAEWRKIEEYSKQGELLSRYEIHTGQELLAFQDDRSKQLEELTAQRQKIYNKARRAAPEEKERLNAEARALSSKMRPLRDERDRADRIYNRSVPRIQELLALERKTETQTRNKLRERGYER